MTSIESIILEVPDPAAAEHSDRVCGGAARQLGVARKV